MKYTDDSPYLFYVKDTLDLSGGIVSFPKLDDFYKTEENRQKALIKDFGGIDHHFICIGEYRKDFDVTQDFLEELKRTKFRGYSSAQNLGLV